MNNAMATEAVYQNSLWDKGLTLYVGIAGGFCCEDALCLSISTIQLLRVFCYGLA